MNLGGINVGKVVRDRAIVLRAAMVTAPISPRIWSKYLAGKRL